MILSIRIRSADKAIKKRIQVLRYSELEHQKDENDRYPSTFNHDRQKRWQIQLDRKENRKHHPDQQQNQNCSSVKGLHTQFKIDIIDPHHPKHEHHNQGGKGSDLEPNRT